MRRPAGYAVIVDPAQSMWERDSISCGHCQRVVFVKPGSASTVYLVQQTVSAWTEEPGAFCRVCMRPICLPCHEVGRCRPWELMIEASEDRGRFRRQAGLD